MMMILRLLVCFSLNLFDDVNRLVSILVVVLQLVMLVAFVWPLIVTVCLKFGSNRFGSFVFCFSGLQFGYAVWPT